MTLKSANLHCKSLKLFKDRSASKAAVRVYQSSRVFTPIQCNSVNSRYSVPTKFLMVPVRKPQIPSFPKTTTLIKQNF